MAMNLSGKRTRTRRNSGESCNIAATKGESLLIGIESIDASMYGVTFRCKDRESYKGIRLSFFMFSKN